MNSLSAWERIEIIRNKDRPTINNYIPLIFDEFYEMHGDRSYGDDPAIMGGIARFQGIPVTVIGHVKGRDLEENKKTNFAMPHPEGYRKALRLVKQAEKFKRPVICFIDTTGAFCGIGAEERGQGEAIATNINEFFGVQTPIISIVTGEGGSGGALALGVCDELAMLENAVYSVISPRGFASILWKDASKEKDASKIMKITADDLFNFGICDYIIPEPPGGAHLNHKIIAERITEYLLKSLENISKKDIANLLSDRYNKFRKIGNFTE